MEEVYFLVGHSCSGKSTLLKELSDSESFRDFDLIDLDYEIESRLGDLSEIISTFGVEHFRNIEIETLKTVLGKIQRGIIALGGGFPLDRVPISDTQLIYLKGDLEEILERVNKNNRPISSLFSVDELREIFELRQEFFEFAEHQINSAKISPKERIKYLEKLLF